MSTAFRRVAVLGLGLIGGSLMHALRHCGVEVVGYDPDAHTASLASTDGFPVAPSDTAAVHGADLVILAMPLPDLPAALRALGDALSPAAMLTDVGTLKTPVHRLVREICPAARFVGGHPLAGTEDSGWPAAHPLLFRDAPWTLTLKEDTAPGDWVDLADLVCELGAKPVPATAADQDAAVARVIGLPHVLAEVLALTGLAGGPLGLSLAAGSYRSGSRVARTRPDLVATWCDDNPALVQALDDVIDRLRAAREHLGARQSVRDLAASGYAARMDWERREFEPVELAADPQALREHGRRGGWITAVLRNGSPAAPTVRLLGMRPR